MKIQVFVRSPEWLHTAGTRIRYKRLQKELSRLGCTLSIEPVSAIREGLKLNADAYLFSKCHDAGALMLADMLREAGALVGFDLFDDYVSGTGSNTAAQRVFQRALHGKADFLLCSTARMAEVARAFDPTVPVHVLNDPFESCDSEVLAQQVDAKQQAVRDSGRMDVVWFGVGNNPVYPVGLSDLAGLWETLKPLLRSGLDVRLKVLTNPDALDAEGLSRLRSLPLPVDVEEWSGAAEKVALDKAYLAFLPVNYQNFSIAKSLNRAVTALTHGAQVLSAGYPLYNALNPFVYRDGSAILSDLEAGIPKVHRSTLESLRARLADLADPAQEASRFRAFLCDLPSGQCEVLPEKRKLRAIVHGAVSTPAIHNLCRSLGWLSLATPITRQPLPYHAHIGFFDGGSRPELRLSRHALPRLADGWGRLAVPLRRGNIGEFTHTLPFADTVAGQYLTSLTPGVLDMRAGRMVHARQVMDAAEATYRQVFGEMAILRSEMEMPLTAIEEMAVQPG